MNDEVIVKCKFFVCGDFFYLNCDVKWRFLGINGIFFSFIVLLFYLYGSEKSIFYWGGGEGERWCFFIFNFFFNGVVCEKFYLFINWI